VLQVKLHGIVGVGQTSGIGALGWAATVLVLQLTGEDRIAQVEGAPAGLSGRCDRFLCGQLSCQGRVAQRRIALLCRIQFWC